MRFLFRAFERHRVRYLVISGQACVLYGAAQFTQDLDLWIDPTRGNLRRLLAALAGLGARVHKLTPPLNVLSMRRGHGFHFLVPAGRGENLYLDLMGQPPRVGTFRAACRRSEAVESEWGTLPLVGIEDLVEIKKTNRPADYEVITSLALIRLRRESSPSAAALRWALGNIFRVEVLWEAVERYGHLLGRGVVGTSPAARRFRQISLRGREPGARDFSIAGKYLAECARRLQDKGRNYWLPRLRELRRWRREGRLIPEGLAVSHLNPAPTIPLRTS